MNQRIITQTRVTEDPVVIQTESASGYQTKKAIFRTYQILYYGLGALETLLLFRFILKLMGANPASGFASFIYTLSSLFLSPFSGIVPTNRSGGSVLEWHTLIAMAVYAVVVWLVVELFQLVKPVEPEEVEQTVDNV